MPLRTASPSDIPALHKVRMSVEENVLNNPALVTEEDYRKFLTTDGKGWLCEYEGEIAGFAIVDAVKHNVWALFVDPRFEGKGIGRQLHDTMLDWFFSQSDETLWLSTAAHTRAERFYRKAGWKETGMHGKEIRFEMNKRSS